MEIINYLDLFLGAILNFFIYIIVIRKLFKQEFCKNKIYIILTFILIALVTSMINVFNKTVFKILLTMPFVITGIKIVFYLNYKYSIIYTIVCTIYTFASEILSVILLSFLNIYFEFSFNNILGTTLAALFVGIFTLLLLLNKSLNKRVISIVKNINEKQNISLFILIFITIGAFGYKNIIDTNTIINLIMNGILFISFIIIFVIYFEENQELYDLSNEYNELFNYLEIYEKDLIDKRKIIHEYKNQLIVINGYIGNEKKLKEYISELINEQKNINENSMIRNIDKLPCGIKGLIYYKFSHISKDITINLEVKNKLLIFDKLNSKLSKDVLKIIGIIIDNAIEAVNNEELKYINVFLTESKNIFKIEVINSFSKNIKIENIMKLGYSTKGKNRGYGLALVKEIIEKEKNLKFYFNNEDEEFNATLEIKI